MPGSGSWRRYIFKGVFWCVSGKVGSFCGLGAKWIDYWRSLVYTGVDGNYGWCLSYSWGLGSNEVGQLKLSYEGGKPQRAGPSFWGEDDPSRHHVLKKKTYHFLDISLYSAEGCSRYRTKVKVKNNSTLLFFG